MIGRDPGAAVRRRHDLIIVGGGVYGVCLAWESARRGHRPLLLERADYGGETSWNSLRLLHGGLRYLQSLDLGRFRESVAERRWFLRHFPDLVRPLPCLMPLYGRGLRRPAVFRLALGVNDLLSRNRNEGVREDRHLPAGEVVDVAGTKTLFPTVREEGLRGGGLWYDASMEASHRLIVEILRRACGAGATCLNYVEAVELLRDDGEVRGVGAEDRAGGESLELRAPVVVNCAGPRVRELARAFDRDLPRLFRPSLAFNLSLERDPPSGAAVAVAPPRPGGRTYFLRPWRGRTLAGTYHAPRPEGTIEARPAEEEIRAFLDDLNAAVPALSLGRDEVERVFAGLLPAAGAGSVELASRAAIHDHGAAGGPAGLYSVSGVKFTTARRVAEKALRRVVRAGGLPASPSDGKPSPRADPGTAAGREEPEMRERLTAADFRSLRRRRPAEAAVYLDRLIEEESVVRPEDLLFRRTSWGLELGERDREELRGEIAGRLGAGRVR